MLERESTELHRELEELRAASPDPSSFARRVDLEVVHDFLDRAGIRHTWSPGATVLQLRYDGTNAEFGVQIQVFPGTNVLFLGTTGLFRLADAQDPDTIVLLLSRIATLNYDLLLGKFQLNPETGEVLLSLEIPIHDGLGYDTLLRSLDALTTAADEHFPELVLIGEGRGL
jgi:hypothetical protein